MSKSYYNKKIGKKLFWKQPLFIVDLTLNPTTHQISNNLLTTNDISTDFSLAETSNLTYGGSSNLTYGGSSNLTYKSEYSILKNNIEIRHGFISILFSISREPYKILRNIFLNKSIKQFFINDFKTLDINFSYLDKDIHKKYKFDIINVLIARTDDIETDIMTLFKTRQIAKSKLNKSKSRIIYKTFNQLTPIVKFWYKLLNHEIMFDLNDELIAIKKAGFIIKKEITPDNNPLGIKYMILSYI